MVHYLSASNNKLNTDFACPPNYYILRMLCDCSVGITESRKLKIDTTIQKVHNLFQKSLWGKGMNMI
jgi:hypothetical protein